MRSFHMNSKALNNLKSVVLSAVMAVGVIFTLNIKAANVDQIKVDKFVFQATSLTEQPTSQEDQVASPKAQAESAVAGAKTSENNGGGVKIKSKKNNGRRSFMLLKEALEQAKKSPVEHIDGLADKKSSVLLNGAYDMYNKRINGAMAREDALCAADALNEYADVIDSIIRLEKRVYLRSRLKQNIIDYGSIGLLVCVLLWAGKVGIDLRSTILEEKRVAAEFTEELDRMRSRCDGI